MGAYMKMMVYIQSRLARWGMFETRALALAVLLASVFSLAFAYTAQYGFGLQPCILCLYQRWPYRIAAGIAVAAGLMRLRWMLWMAVPLYLSGAGIALFQVGVEQHWWRGTDDCVGGDITGLSGADLMAKIQSAPVVRCDEIQFEFLGISMAGYNGLLSLGLAAALAYCLLRGRFKTGR